MRMIGRRRDLVALCLGLGLATLGTACAQSGTADVEARAAASSAPPRAAPATAPSTAAGPTTGSVPTDHDLAVALPGPEQVAGLRGHTSCLAGEQACLANVYNEPDPHLSWVRVNANAQGPLGPRWAELQVNRVAGPEGTLEQERELVRSSCPDGGFEVQPEPRGFHPHGPMAGSRQGAPVRRAGFRGVRCDVTVGPVGGERHDEHWLVALRDDVRLRVSASSPALVLRLFEEYADRLALRGGER